MQSVASSLGPHAFSAIYRENVAFVRQAIRRLGVPSWLEDDAVQDVFVVAHRHLGDFAGDRHDGWLLVIARRVAFRHRRTALRQRRKLESLRLWLGLAPSDRPWQAPEARLLLQEMTTRLAREQREAFDWCEVQGYTALEAAAQLGINPNTVSTRLRAARHELRRVLIDVPHEPAPPSRAAFARAWLLLWPRLVTGSWWPATQAGILATCTAVLVASGVAMLSPRPVKDVPGPIPARGEIATTAEVVAEPPQVATPAEMPTEVAPRVEAPAPTLQRPSGRREAAEPSEASLPLLGAEDLAQAWRALDRGDLEQARALVDAHRRRYPDSTLGEERQRLVQRIEDRASNR